MYFPSGQGLSLRKTGPDSKLLRFVLQTTCYIQFSLDKDPVAYYTQGNFYITEYWSLHTTMLSQQQEHSAESSHQCHQCNHEERRMEKHTAFSVLWSTCAIDLDTFPLLWRYYGDRTHDSRMGSVPPYQSSHKTFPRLKRPGGRFYIQWPVKKCEIRRKDALCFLGVGYWVDGYLLKVVLWPCHDLLDKQQLKGGKTRHEQITQPHRTQ